jgi:hypothetical protein
MFTRAPMLPPQRQNQPSHYYVQSVVVVKCHVVSVLGSRNEVTLLGRIKLISCITTYSYEARRSKELLDDWMTRLVPGLCNCVDGIDQHAPLPAGHGVATGPAAYPEQDIPTWAGRGSAMATNKSRSPRTGG